MQVHRHRSGKFHGTSGKDKWSVWWLACRGSDRDKAGASCKPPTLCSADFIVKNVGTMQYLEWENDIISQVENILVGAWTRTHTNMFFLLLKSELRNSEVFNLFHPRSCFEGRMAFT